MLPRLVVHAGFHKTGTSSVQKMLEKGRGPLGRVARVLLKRDMAAMCESARAYSADPTEVELTLFAAEVAAVFETIDPADPRVVILSSEDLSGHIPGRKGREGYPAAPQLMAALLATVGEVWGHMPGADFYFSTRAPQAWVASCHAQHLRATRMRDDLETYAAWQLPHADLPLVVRAVQARLADVAPVRVHHRALAEVKDLPLGPLTPILDLAHVPANIRARLRNVAPTNTSLPPAVLAQFLALNRSDLSRDALRTAKQALIDAAA